MEWKKAEDINKRIEQIVEKLKFSYIEPKQLFCFRSYGSKSRARARIWSLPRVWQQALKVKPSYVIEVLHEKFDQLSYNEQTKVLIHELLHIPKTFSGALRPHRGRYVKVNDRHVEKLFEQYKNRR